MNDNAFYFVLAIAVFAILFNGFLSWAERDRRTSWRQRKNQSRKRLLTRNK